MKRLWLVLGTLVAWAGVTTTISAQPLVLREAPVLLVGPDGSASVDLALINEGKAPVTLRLNLSDFVHRRPDGGKTYALGTTRTLAPVDTGNAAILAGKAPLPGDTTLDVRLMVTKVWETGQSEARLKNAEEDIAVRGGPREAVVKAVRIPATYSVQIVSATPETPEVQFRGDRALVGLKNSDPHTYRFAWKLRLDGRLYDGGAQFIDLAPGGIRWVTLTRPERQADFPSAGLLTAGTLKDEIVKGDLILEPIFDGDAVTRPLPPKDLPVTFRFSFWPGPNWTQLFNGTFIFLLLMIGGIASIGLHYGIPNAARALALERRLGELNRKLRALGTDVESRRRVMLETHLPAIRGELTSYRWVFPSFTATLDIVTRKFDMVQQWVDLAYGLSIVMGRTRQSSEQVPLTVFRWIQDRCARALTPIESGFTTPEEIAAMKADVKAAEGYLDISLARLPNADLEKEIQQREERLIPLREELVAQYPALAGLVKQLPDRAGTALTPADYIDRDGVSLKINLLRAFDRRVRQLTGAANAEAVQALARLTARGPALMSYLAADTHESLRIALLFINEMRQDIYADDGLAAALKMQPPALHIVTSPAEVHARTPCMLTLRFDRDILNEASARLEWTCTWDFGDDSPRESGWEVFHSYDKAGPRDVRVTVADLDANSLAPPAQLQERINVHAIQDEGTGDRWLSPEMRVELVRTAIVLALTMFGLMATARQQVESLSFLGAVGAMIALGFGVDTIKNLALQRPSGG